MRSVFVTDGHTLALFPHDQVIDLFHWEATPTAETDAATIKAWNPSAERH
ncbi:hypothetical protein [Streptomyces antimycoticus]